MEKYVRSSIFFQEEISAANELKFYAAQETGLLTKSNEKVLDYLSSDLLVTFY